MTHPQDKGNEGLSLREQLIQEAETALYATETVTDDMASATLAERHMVIVMERLLAFIKGQNKIDMYDHLNNGPTLYAYTDPETLLP